MLFASLNSCKKESSTDETIDPKREQEMLTHQNGPKVENIDLMQFKSQINLSALGSLKEQFITTLPSKSKISSVNTVETYFGLKIKTDRIKLIKANGHKIYIFSVVLSDNNSISFQNLTIDESSSGTVAFVNTYTPTNKWIKDWKNGHPGKFEGDINVIDLDLGNSGNKLSNASKINTKANSSQSPNAVSNADGQNCTTKTYYYEVAYSCGSGQHYPWDAGCTLNGDERAGYTYNGIDITTCDGGGVGGGGATSPTPPSDYDENRLPEDTDEMRAFEGDYKLRMSQAELIIYNKMSRLNQLTYLTNAKAATLAAELLFPNTVQKNSKADAFRHAYFSFLNAMAFGIEMAKKLGDAHEETPNNDKAEKQMDLFNNDAGRRVYTNSNFFPDYDPAGYFQDKIIKLINAGELVYIKDGVVTPTNK